MIKRRSILTGGIATAALWATFRPSPATAFEIERGDADWRARLSAKQYAILRRHGTERPYTSPLNAEKRAGIFACAGCDLLLFSSEAKYDSGTGWPSF